MSCIKDIVDAKLWDHIIPSLDELGDFMDWVEELGRDLSIQKARVLEFESTTKGDEGMSDSLKDTISIERLHKVATSHGDFLDSFDCAGVALYIKQLETVRERMRPGKATGLNEDNYILPSALAARLDIIENMARDLTTEVIAIDGRVTAVEATSILDGLFPDSSHKSEDHQDPTSPSVELGVVLNQLMEEVKALANITSDHTPKKDGQ